MKHRTKFDQLLLIPLLVTQTNSLAISMDWMASSSPQSAVPTPVVATPVTIDSPLTPSISSFPLPANHTATPSVSEYTANTMLNYHFETPSPQIATTTTSYASPTPTKHAEIDLKYAVGDGEHVLAKRASYLVYQDVTYSPLPPKKTTPKTSAARKPSPKPKPVVDDVPDE